MLTVASSSQIRKLQSRFFVRNAFRDSSRARWSLHQNKLGTFKKCSTRWDWHGIKTHLFIVTSFSAKLTTIWAHLDDIHYIIVPWDSRHLRFQWKSPWPSQRTKPQVKLSMWGFHWWLWGAKGQENTEKDGWNWLNMVEPYEKCIAVILVTSRLLPFLSSNDFCVSCLCRGQLGLIDLQMIRWVWPSQMIRWAFTKTERVGTFPGTLP